MTFVEIVSLFKLVAVMSWGWLVQTTNKTPPAARPQEVVTGDQLEKYKICQNLYFLNVSRRAMERKWRKNRSMFIDDLHLMI